MTVTLITPGFTGTDFNNHRGTQTVTEGTDAIVHLATLPPDGPTGTFQDRYGLVPCAGSGQADRHDIADRDAKAVPRTAVLVAVKSWATG